MTTGEYRIPIGTEFDVTRASLQVLRCAREQGFDKVKVAMLATVVSELTTNILKYAGTGELVLRPIERGGKRGLLIRVSDRGPGIEDVEAALRDHHSTGGTLGLGLPGVRRMMDEFELESEAGRGTTITVKKWN